MSRSSWKYKFVDNKLLRIRNLQKNKSLKNKIIKLKSRNSTIMPNFVDFECQIYNGFNYKNLVINEKMINQKFGEFNYSRVFPQHKKKLKK